MKACSIPMFGLPRGEGQLNRIHAVETESKKRRDAENAEERRGKTDLCQTRFSEFAGKRNPLRLSAFSASLRLSRFSPFHGQEGVMRTAFSGGAR